jgi:hypothetical protein
MPIVAKQRAVDSKKCLKIEVSSLVGGAVDDVEVVIGVVGRLAVEWIVIGDVKDARVGVAAGAYDVDALHRAQEAFAEPGSDQKKGCHEDQLLRFQDVLRFVA